MTQFIFLFLYQKNDLSKSFSFHRNNIMSEKYNHYLQLLNYYEGFIRQCESGNHPHNSDPLYHLIRSKQARLKRMQILSYLEELESS